MILALFLSISPEAEACGMPHDYQMSLAAMMEEVEAVPELIFEAAPTTPAEAFELLAPPVENELDVPEQQQQPASSAPVS
ncbi:MAG TPA: hypothetical protein QGF58_17790 [Myxococcota bacterium]|nr:hypothetical protein [Myxococcota bacterium]